MECDVISGMGVLVRRGRTQLDVSDNLVFIPFYSSLFGLGWWRWSWCSGGVEWGDLGGQGAGGRGRDPGWICNSFTVLLSWRQ